MISIRFRNCYDIADMAGHSVKEVREAFKTKLSIPDKAGAKLNDSSIQAKAESRVMLTDDDELSFIKTNNRKIYLGSALFLILAVTGGMFAYGYTNFSVTISATLNGGDGTDFVNVTANNSIPINWAPYGNSSGATGNGTFWDINTLTSGYTGDLTATVYLTNIDKLSHVYRGLGLFITIYNSAGNVVDINGDGSANVSSDNAFLSMKNGVVDLNIPGAADVFTVFLNSGFFVTLPYDVAAWSEGASPSFYLEISQK
jgi:hypothetical protein